MARAENDEQRETIAGLRTVRRRSPRKEGQALAASEAECACLAKENATKVARSDYDRLVATLEKQVDPSEGTFTIIV